MMSWVWVGISVVMQVMAAVGVESTRLRMTFPGVLQGEEMHEATLGYWRAWLIEREYDVAGFLRREGTVDIILRDGDSLAVLEEAGFRALEREASRPLVEAEANEDRFVPPAGYVNPTTLLTFLQSEAAAHPTITNLLVIGQSLQGRSIYAMEISNHPGVVEDKPSILFNGLHHSREVVTPHVVMDAITYLTDQYVAGNPVVVNWVDNYKIYCVPMVNPDGSNYVFTVDDFHRKNMRAGCASNPGVDLNRNYTYHWGSGTANCERGTGSSGTTCADSYRGTSAGSEPEAQVMMNFAAQKRFVIAVSYHSYGEFIDYPYACNDGNPNQSMPEHAVIDEMMDGMAAGIVSTGGPLYDVFSPVAIGPVNGDDTSWYYANNGTYAMIVEVGTSFLPSFAAGMTFVAQNRGGWLYLLDRLDGARIDVRVADHLTGLPLNAQVEILNFTFDTGELPRLADTTFGRSRWLVPANGTYTVRVSETGYQT
ncbi:MAG: M14 family metallopeptidase, partial [Planctomycetota bacterium]